MKQILFVLFIVIAVSCNKDDDDCGCTIISLDTNISLKNAAGEDLLDPNNPNSYKESQIKTYYLIDGEEKIADTEEFIFEDIDGIYRLRVFVNSKGNDEFPITYIDWNETDRDTIKSEIYKTDNNTTAINIWYNDELKWGAENLSAREFTIIK